MALLSGSPAIGAGIPISGITTDQRGVPIDSEVDIGAFQAATFVVKSVSGSVDTTIASLSLPGAVVLANQFPGSSIIFDPAIFATPRTITLRASLELSNTILTTTIAGPATGVTVSGGNQVRVFQVESAVTATFIGLSITGGYSTGDGGGLFNDGGTITLSGVSLTGNSAYGRGGGLFNTKRGTTTVTTCTAQRQFRGRRRRPLQ